MSGKSEDFCRECVGIFLSKLEGFAKFFDFEFAKCESVDELLGELERFKSHVEKWMNDLQVNNLALQQLIDAQLEELSAAYEGLSALFEINKIISSVNEPWLILGSVLRVLKNAVNYSSAIVWIRLNEDVYYEHQGDTAIIEKLQAVARSTNETLFADSDPELGGYIIVPLASELGSYGFIALASGTKKMLTAGDKKITEAVAQLLLSAIDRYIMLQREIEKKRLEEQLAIARNIQQGLLPSKFPRTARFEVYGKSVPAVQVGGDYYDVLEMDDGSIMCCLADVSGKGLPAALIMSSFRTMFRLSTAITRDLVNLAGQFDRMISGDFEVGRFITAVIFKISPDGLMEVVNAGHDPIYVLRGGNLIKIESTGTPFGILGEGFYEIERLQLSSGDLIVTYTDGIVEARNVKEEEYGFQRFEEFILRNRYLKVEDFVEKLFGSVMEFSQGMPQHDDTTALVVRYVG
ncbi:PP2C family protein-serine/threonine phosphatase [Fervidobacterium thailandense]|uniref:Stage II sporulation protein E n=1 Tax=Fervidobacterium thailandense TaxID=1008305 RepID=A0A1E3G469_9BACT|nr:SpoIIE family protein phosphatase [Fervidobacterium thailandense]ODN31037.1 stage II sporulation protein E [Fervidobacterium thailandense]